MSIQPIDRLTRGNEDFRRVVQTSEHSQLVLMTIDPGDEIGSEVHDDVDQILVVVEGEAETILDGVSATARPGDLVHVPAGTRHNIVAAGSSPLRLWTVYAPPEHPDGTVHATKAEADAYESEHHG